MNEECCNHNCNQGRDCPLRKKGTREMTYISRCEHGTPMALCQKCFPDVSEHNDWSNYKYTHPVKELTDDLRIKELESEIERLQDQLNEFLVARDLAILRKAQEK